MAGYETASPLIILATGHRARHRHLGLFLSLLFYTGGSKTGMFPSELRYALDCARCLPLDEVFFIPVRIEDCQVPSRITKCIQYVDLFPVFDTGFRNILKAMEKKH